MSVDEGGDDCVGPQLLAAKPQSCGFVPLSGGWAGDGAFDLPGRAGARLMSQECDIGAKSGGPTTERPCRQEAHALPR